MIVAGRLAVLARDQTVVNGDPSPTPRPVLEEGRNSLPSEASLSPRSWRASLAARDFADLLQF